MANEKINPSQFSEKINPSQFSRVPVFPQATVSFSGLSGSLALQARKQLIKALTFGPA